MPKPKLDVALATEAKQKQPEPTSFLPSVQANLNVIFFLLLPSFSLTSSLQMTDSFVSTRTGDLASNGVPNGSSPSLNPQSHNISVIRKKLMGYVGFANLPNQVHRKSVRKGFSFTAMVVG